MDEEMCSIFAEVLVRPTPSNFPRLDLVCPAPFGQAVGRQRSLVEDDPDSERIPARTVCAAFSLLVLGLVRVLCGSLRQQEEQTQQKRGEMSCGADRVQDFTRGGSRSSSALFLPDYFSWRWSE